MNEPLRLQLRNNEEILVEVALPVDGKCDYLLEQNGARLVLFDRDDDGQVVVTNVSDGEFILLNGALLAGTRPVRTGDTIGMLSREYTIGLVPLAGDATPHTPPGAPPPGPAAEPDATDPGKPDTPPHTESPESADNEGDDSPPPDPDAPSDTREEDAPPEEATVMLRLPPRDTASAPPTADATRKALASATTYQRSERPKPPGTRFRMLTLLALLAAAIWLWQESTHTPWVWPFADATPPDEAARSPAATDDTGATDNPPQAPPPGHTEPAAQADTDPAVPPQIRITMRGADPEVLPMGEVESLTRVPPPDDTPGWRRALESPVGCLAIAERANLIAAGTADGRIHLLDLDSGQPVATLDLHTDSIADVALSEDGTRLLAGSYDGNASVWDVPARRPVMALGAHPIALRAVDLSRDATRALTADVEGLVVHWNIETGEDIRFLLGHTGLVNDARFSPDESLAATAGADGMVIVWDLDTGKRVRAFGPFESGVNAVAFSPDGARLAAALDGYTVVDQSLRIMNTPTLVLLPLGDDANPEPVRDTPLWALDVAFSPDGATLAAASGGDPDPQQSNPDRRPAITLWNPDTADRLGSLIKHTGPVTALVFTRDGSALLSSSLDRTVRRWPLD